MLTYITHQDCLMHDTGEAHPETSSRLDAISNQLIMSGIDFVVLRHDAPKATREELSRVHSDAHIDRMFKMAPDSGMLEIDGDTVMSAGTLNAALRAAGAGVLAVDLVMSGKANPAFCAVRPPGHHAERDRAMGFCLFNNVAVAAAHALETWGLSRVAIVDFDVHHGNGTEDIFRDESRILFCSSFQHPFYPFSGNDSDAQNLIAVPFPAATDGKAFRAGISERWLPALHAFRPELLLVSAGFDAHVLDDMSSLALVEADFGWITSEILMIAKTYAEGRVVSFLEGGYENGALARSVIAHLRALME